MAIQNGNIFSSAEWKEDSVPKLTLCKTDVVTLDVYYFKPGQRLGYHRHPTGDQIFTVLEGEGTFYLDESGEEKLTVKPGSTFVAPANVWHDLHNTSGNNLVAQQVTKQPAGMEKR
ncbi:MAG: cupin domain-containing protein [Nitrospinae bacterium]|nr:cupin domain-containing protein [Nitrospinota bacterium]